MKGENESRTYLGPKNVADLTEFVKDATDYYQRPPAPKVGE